MQIGHASRAGVTGATGFLGRHLVELLVQQGVLVRALLRPSTHDPFTGNNRVVISRGDLCDRDAVRRFVEDVDVVFHTAAQVSPWVRTPAIQHAINAQGTRWVVEAAESLGKRAICTSSIVALEADPPRLVRLLDGNHYTRSKREALELVRAARARGARVSTIIPSGILGPGDRRPTAIGDLIRRVVRSDRPTLSFQAGLYFVDVRTVAQAHWRALFQDPDDFWILGEYWELDRFYARIYEMCGKQTRILRVPTALVFAGSAILSASAQMWTQRAPEITPAWVYYLRHARDMRWRDDTARLGIEAPPLEQGLADTVAWFKAEQTSLAAPNLELEFQ